MTRAVVVVQEIRTIWTKAARGGSGAVQRNVIPEAARLTPQAVRAANGLDLLHHRLVYRERADTGITKPAREEFIENPTNRLYSVGCVEVGRPPGEDQAFATFRYDTNCGGAPERGWIQKTLFLPMGEWGTILYNGRFSQNEGEWHYEKTVVNVGLFALPLANGSVFTREEPSQRFSAMAHLF